MMVFQLYRNQFEKGTYGVLFVDGQFVCFTIELPWKDNARNVSCIPDGCYELELWFTDRFKHHLVVRDVPGRSGILIHPANDALKELRGCIAPVSHLSGVGKGLYSRSALDKLVMLAERSKTRNEPLYIKITTAAFAE